jgi:hypothetical protein
MDNHVAKRVPESGLIINVSIDIGQAEGGNITEVTPGMVDWVLRQSDKDLVDLSESQRVLVREQTAGALRTALKHNGYWAD